MHKYKDTDIPIVDGECVTQEWPTTSEGVIEAFDDGILTVDKMLDYVDLDLAWYVPSKYAIEFIVFIRLVLGEEPENNNPKAHYFLMDCIFNQDNVKPFFDARGIDFDELQDRVVVLCTREFAKSVMVVYLILFLAARGSMPGFGKVQYGIYVSDSMRNNVETTMTTIAKVYQESKYLRSIFEETRLIQTEVNFVRKPSTPKEIEMYTQHVIIEKQSPNTVPGRMKRTLSVTGLGAATGGRGSRDGLARPDFAIFDDMIPSEKEAESETVLANIESTIESDILKALSGNGNFAIAFGTPYNKKDPIYRRIEEGSWLPVVFPRAKKFDETTTPANFVSVWPDRHTYKQCRRDYMVAKRAEDKGNKMPMRKLLQENYLRISNEKDRMISDTMIQWFNRVDLEKHIGAYNIYITTDLTTTGSDGSDYSGIAAWAVGSNSDMFLLDLSLKKLELEEQYNEIFRMVKHYANLTGRGITVGIEIDGQQKTHIFALKDRMVLKNEWFTMGRGKGSNIDAEGIMSRLEGGNKHWRFRMMLPQWQNKKIWFPRELKDSPDMYELLEELKYVTYNGFGSVHDDGCDLISQLGSMEIQFPMRSRDDSFEASKKGQRQNEGMWDSEERVVSSAYDSYA